MCADCTFALSTLQLYALSGYDGTQRYFTGQVGIAQIEVYTDNTLSTKVC